MDPVRYLKGKTPPTEKSSLEVEVNTEVWVILDIEEVAQVIQLQFELSLKWVDSRLQFYNLKDDVNMNSLLFEEKQKLWVPSVIFQNTKDQEKSLNDEETRIVVEKLENGTFNADGLLPSDIDIFSGEQNLLVISRVYNIEFLCDYQMQWYPFDTQTCYMEFTMQKDMKKFVELLPGMNKYIGPADLSVYFIKGSEIEKYHRNGQHGVRVSVTLGRRLLGVFLTVYLPTVLMNLIGHSTNFFKDFFFEAVVTVNLTCMLVLTTMFISVSNALPKTSYIKMIDVWLIFTLLMPFMEVLLHTYMDLLRNDENREINHHGSTMTQNVENDDSCVINVRPSKSASFSPADLVSRREDVQVAALKDHYEKMKVEKKQMKNMKRLQFCHNFAMYYSPIMALVFVAVYWILGLRHAEFF